MNQVKLNAATAAEMRTQVLSMGMFHVDPIKNSLEIILHTTRSYKINFSDLLMIVNVLKQLRLRWN